MKTIEPYLFFAGHCEDALNFYKHALGATVTMLMRFNESPESLPDGWLQDGFENKIMHASFNIGSMTFWSPRYGMVTDKFNVGWMVLVRDTPT